VAKPEIESMYRMNRRGGFAVVTAAAIALLMTAPGRAQDDARALTEAYNAGGSALFKQVSAAPGNIVLSPLSVGTAMAMALSGARGETEREMASVLAQRLDRSAMAAANAALLTALKLYDKSAASCPQGMQITVPAGGAQDGANGGARCEGALRPDGRCVLPAVREGGRCVAAGSPQPSARLLTANALMLAGRGDLVAGDYAALLKDKFGAEIFRDAGLNDVNAWVKRKTEGKIERILDTLDHSAAAVILNAVYFKAKWAAVFAKAATMDAAFNLSQQKKISVPTMRRSGSYALVVQPLYRALRLPYEVGQIGMIIVLPNDVAGLDAVSRRFEADEWTQLAGALQARDATKPTDLALPRFKASFDANLVPDFQAQGMVRAFDLKQADFSGMTGRPPSQVPLAIGTIVHRAVIDVMEDGTEAAAATAITAVTASVQRPPDEMQVFHVDHPFLFAIVDDASGTVLFQGRIVDPR
jgi:leukocyte elastase inhibitor